MPNSQFGLRNFIGQKNEVAKLKRQLDGARACGEPLPPMLFIGPSGTGKTYLGGCLAEEFGTSLILTHGKDSEGTLGTKFARVKHGDIVLIDEAHNLSPEAQEMLYEVIDKSQVPEGKAAESRDEMVCLEIPPCTVILATNLPGKLLDALQKRMEVTIDLDYYPLDEMRDIVDYHAADMNLLLSPKASRLVAQVSGGLPRRAKHHLRNLRRHYPDAQRRQLRSADVCKYLEMFRIDEQGLGQRELAYMRYLAKVGKASLDSIRLHLGLDANYVRQQIEARLQRLGCVAIRGGRVLTASGRKWLAMQQERGH